MAAETRICTGVHASSSDQIRRKGLPEVRCTTIASRGQLTAKLAATALAQAAISRTLQPFSPRSPPMAVYVRLAAAAPNAYSPKLNAVFRTAGRGVPVKPTDRAAAPAAKVAPAAPRETTAARMTARDSERPMAPSDNITPRRSASAAVAQEIAMGTKSGCRAFRGVRTVA